ncbi:MAG: hypothetical protein PHS52_01625 [Desulfotomaculaceae bacterium]|nr:hypothetical protein [Desulfotomaculaceae bacterium]
MVAEANLPYPLPDSNFNIFPHFTHRVSAKAGVQVVVDRYHGLITTL